MCLIYQVVNRQTSVTKVRPATRVGSATRQEYVCMCLKYQIVTRQIPLDKVRHVTRVSSATGQEHGKGAPRGTLRNT